MDLDLKGKVAIIIGATRGLGRAMAEALATEGMAVASRITGACIPVDGAQGCSIV